MSKVEIFICNLCERRIYDYVFNGSRMVDWERGDNQVWPTESGPIDICQHCCFILMQAKALGIINYDLEPLYISAGWKKVGDRWVPGTVSR